MSAILIKFEESDNIMNVTLLKEDDEGVITNAADGTISTTSTNIYASVLFHLIRTDTKFNEVIWKNTEEYLKGLEFSDEEVLDSET